MTKRRRPKLARTVPGIFVQAVARVRSFGPPLHNYPYSVPAIRLLTELVFETPVTFFVGENGSGKSTLLEGIAVAFGLNPEGGTKHERFSTRATHSDLFASLILTKSRDAPTDSYFLRAESFYNVASAVDPGDADRYGGRALHEQSHGESFLSLVLHRLRGNGLYLFDEPEAALSPARQLALLAAMHRLVRRNSQFIIATHSPILLGYPGATIYLFAESKLARIDYLDTEHYQITKAFLERPERMLNELLRLDDPSDK
ncbi:MAG TPA: AAA family ATPase [Gemmatimonadales bacterium]|nr:AAA family ATPase [Gemmatimonadales bacterium]